MIRKDTGFQVVINIIENAVKYNETINQVFDFGQTKQSYLLVPLSYFHHDQ